MPSSLVTTRNRVIKMRRLLRFVFICALAGAMTALAVGSAKADCMTERLIGIGKADALDKAMRLYDDKARIYNQNIKHADNAFASGNDMDNIWPQVLIARDQLIKAAEQASLTLDDMNSFSREYLSSGCFDADPDKVEQEYQQTSTTIKTSMQTLAKVPENWQDRYNRSKICSALNEREQQGQKRGREWADKYDGLIEIYDEARKTASALDPADPGYAKARKNLIDARNNAFPGVAGYPQILADMFDITIMKQNAGCISLTPAQLKSYTDRQSIVKVEIETKSQQMQNLEQDFPVASRQPKAQQPASYTPKPQTEPKQAPATQQAETPIIRLRASPDNNADDNNAVDASPSRPAISSASTDPITAEISIRNRSGDILCLFDSNSAQTACDFMAGEVRKITATRIIAFGGGYWSSNGQYMQMKTCRILTPKPQEQAVMSGIDPDCSPASL